MVSKVCSACDEMYTDAQRALAKEGVRALWERDWTLAVQAKQAAFRGLAQLHQAGVCRAAGAPGEEIARLQSAADQLRAAGALGGAVARDAAARAARALARATKDNDFIYHERVPERAALEPVPRAPIAKALPPPPAFASASKGKRPTVCPPVPVPPRHCSSPLVDAQICSRGWCR